MKQKPKIAFTRVLKRQNAGDLVLGLLCLDNRIHDLAIDRERNEYDGETGDTVMG